MEKCQTCHAELQGEEHHGDMTHCLQALNARQSGTAPAGIPEESITAQDMLAAIDEIHLMLRGHIEEGHKPK